MSKEMSRRSFLKTGTAVAAGIAVAPNIIIAGEKTPKKEKKKKVAANDKLNILGVGIGGRGAADLAEMETENIIGLCDVDWKYADHVFNKYPQAKKYNDYRVMFDEMLDKADAVMVATADHTHAIIAAPGHGRRKARLRRETADADRLRGKASDQTRRQVPCRHPDG